MCGTTAQGCSGLHQPCNQGKHHAHPHPPCSKEQRDRFRLSTGGAQQAAPPQASCPVLLLLAVPPPPPPLAQGAALAAAESGAKQCRKPARVSTA